MREIKFRAWSPDNKRMFLLEQLGFYGDTLAAFEFADDLYNARDIVMQYTGLKDKNGKEIYEGDIVNKQYFNLSVSDGIGAVEMGRGGDSDGWAHGEWYGWKAGNSSLLDVAEKCEVIGNIYENPEILKL